MQWIGSNGSVYILIYFVSISSEVISLVATGVRKREKGSQKGKSGNPSVVSDDVLNVGPKSRKGDKRHLQNITCSDGAKYMSYFKVSGFWEI